MEDTFCTLRVGEDLGDREMAWIHFHFIFFFFICYYLHLLRVSVPPIEDFLCIVLHELKSLIRAIKLDPLPQCTALLCNEHQIPEAFWVLLQKELGSVKTKI